MSSLLLCKVRNGTRDLLMGYRSQLDGLESGELGLEKRKHDRIVCRVLIGLCASRSNS